MMDLHDKLSMGARAPPSQQLAQAFVDYFRFRHKTARALEDTQALYALETFEHLRETYTEDPDFGVTGEELRMALEVLRKTVDSKKNDQKAHNKLARAIFEELKKRRVSATDNQKPPVPFYRDLLLFIHAIAQLDDALYARDLVEQNWDDCLEHAGFSSWIRVAKGLIRENRVEELEKTIDKWNVPFSVTFHETITVFYAARQANMEMTKKWYQHPIVDNKRPSLLTEISVLKLCISQNELDWGEHVFSSINGGFLEDPPKESQREKAPWDVTLLWAAAIGKNVDEIERMMQVVARRQGEQGMRPTLDIETINSLVELSISRNDAYTAERYVALGERWNFWPNTRTCLLQLDYRTKVGDLAGARAAYANLRGEEIVDSADVPLLNKLIVALCTEKRQNYDAIMGLAEDMSERKARFEPETVAALSLLHLERGEMDDLIDLLNTHAFHHGLDQRALISEVLMSYITDHNTPTSRAWETYNILRQTFSEIDPSTRTSLMQHFFSRERSDMATHVFGHMRQQQIKSLRPTVSTYVACFSGIAKAGDLESLKTVHNMMKLDSAIEPNTQLYNALMLAYTGCGEHQTAQNFWEDIVQSIEGPSYASIQIAFMACERAVFGERMARDIWGRLKRFEIEITRKIYAAYVGALAGQHLFGECVKLINDSEKEAGYKPDALL